MAEAPEGNPTNMSSILFIKTSSLGDVIHHMPAVTQARRNQPAARLSWVVEAAFAPLVRLHAALDAVIPVDSRGWRRGPHPPPAWRELTAVLAALRAPSHGQIIASPGPVGPAGF